MHWVWEALAVACLVHRWTRAAAGHSTDAADPAYAAYGSLLNTAGLGADHVDACVICIGTVDANRRVAWSLVRTTMIDPVLGRVRMVTARAHWDAMLLDVEVRVVGGAAGWACAIYTIGRGASGDHDALAVLEGGGGVRAHDVAQVGGHVGSANLRIWDDAVDDGGVGSVHVVLAALVAAIWIAWMVGGRGDGTGVRACTGNRCSVALSVVACVLLLAVVAIVVGVAGVGAVGGVVLFARLRADATEAPEPRTALARVVVMIVVVVRVAHRASALVDVLVWTEMVVVRAVNAVVTVSDVVHVDVRANVGLAELIQDGSGSLGVDRRDLRHYLPIVVV